MPSIAFPRSPKICSVRSPRMPSRAIARSRPRGPALGPLNGSGVREPADLMPTDWLPVGAEPSAGNTSVNPGVVVRWVLQFLIDLNGRSVLMEQGRHGIGTVSKRCVAAFIEHKHVERMTSNFGEVSVHAAVP